MKRLFPVLLLALLLFGSLQNRARAASTPPEKTASGSPGENPNKHATFNPVLTIQLQRDAAMWGEGTVLDVDVGPNLYAYVRQNPWSKFDPTGLGEKGFNSVNQIFQAVDVTPKMRTRASFIHGHIPVHSRANGSQYFIDVNVGKYKIGGNEVTITPEGFIHHKATGPITKLLMYSKWGRTDVLMHGSPDFRVPYIMSIIGEDAATKLALAIIAAEADTGEERHVEPEGETARDVEDSRRDAERDMRDEQEGDGTIYRVPGEDPETGEKLTPSGKDYIGRGDNFEEDRSKYKGDGRDRSKADKVGSYDPTLPNAGAEAEQDAIDDAGGIDNLDNKRNERKR